MFLKNFYLFGQPFIPKIKGDKQFKTPLGGLITIIIYSVGLSYLLYNLLQWQLGEFQPKFSSIQKNFKYKTVKEEPLLEIAFSNNALNQIDPFAIQNNIIVPLLFYLNPDAFFDDYETIFHMIEEPNEPIYSRKINLKYQLTQNLDSNIDYPPFKTAIIALVRCKQEYLPEGGYCASEQEIDEYIQQPQLILNVNFKLKQFNCMTGEMEEFKRPLYQLLDYRSVLYNEILYQPYDTRIFEGILFYKERTEEYLGGISMNSQNVSREYMQAFSNVDSISQFLIRLDSVRVEQTVSYIRLGEVLAEAGSIFSLLSLSGFFVMFWNEKQMESELVQQVYKMYFKTDQINNNIYKLKLKPSKT